jgi:hypothetical protein
MSKNYANIRYAFFSVLLSLPVFNTDLYQTHALFDSYRKIDQRENVFLAYSKLFVMRTTG